MDPFLGEIQMVGFNFAPVGWAMCDGSLLPISQYDALFSLLGTTYGGDGRVNFALPNVQGRVPNHMGAGFTLGEIGGETAHTLNTSEMPAHNHVPLGNKTNPPTSASAAGHLWGFVGDEYATTGQNGAMNPAGITNTGGSQAHENMSPYLVLNFIIALQGIFPTPN